MRGEVYAAATPVSRSVSRTVGRSVIRRRSMRYLLVFLTLKHESLSLDQLPFTSEKDLVPDSTLPFSRVYRTCRRTHVRCIGAGILPIISFLIHTYLIPEAGWSDVVHP